MKGMIIHNTRNRKAFHDSDLRLTKYTRYKNAKIDTIKRKEDMSSTKAMGKNEGKGLSEPDVR